MGVQKIAATVAIAILVMLPAHASAGAKSAREFRIGMQIVWKPNGTIRRV